MQAARTCARERAVGAQPHGSRTLQDLSPEARRLVAEKPDAWEYRLTLEVLNTAMRPVLQRWSALQRGLYSHALTRIPSEGVIPWMQDRLAEAGAVTETFASLANDAFGRAWGAPGQPGDPEAIVLASRLFAEMCASALAWEERVRFAAVDPPFEPGRRLFVGVAGRLIDEATKLPAFIADALGDDTARGTQALNMVAALPASWANDLERALRAASEECVANPRG